MINRSNGDSQNSLITFLKIKVTRITFFFNLNNFYFEKSFNKPFNLYFNEKVLNIIFTYFEKDIY
jgi:hypothetical protein